MSEKNNMDRPQDEVLEEGQDKAAAEEPAEIQVEDLSWELEGAPKAAAPAEAAAAEEAALEPEPEPAALDPFASPMARQMAEDAEAAVEPEPAYELEPEPMSEAEPEPEPEPAQEPEPEPAYEPEPEAAYEPEVDYTSQWKWKVLSGGYDPFVYAAGEAQILFGGPEIFRVDDLSGANRYLGYLVDYPESPGMGLLALSTEPKYAEVLARKNLEEAGELSPEGSLHIFSKRKVEGGQVNVFYEVMPRERHSALGELYNGYAKGFIIYDTVSLLNGLVKKLGRGVHAVALHLEGAILMVAGKGGDVHLARRYTLMGNDEQALIEGIYALQQDLVALEKNLAAKIDRVHWLEAMTTTLNVPRPEVEIPLEAWPVHQLTLAGETVWSALPTAMERVPSCAALGPKDEIWLRPLEMAEKWMWVAFLALAIVCGFGIYSMQSVKSRIQSQVDAMKQEMRQAEADIRSRAVKVRFEDVGPAVDLSRDFSQAATSPPFGEMWNFLASLRPKPVRVDGLDLTYNRDNVAVRLEGQVEMELTAAQHAFTLYQKDLENAGFKVISQQIDLELEGNYFALNLQWPLQGEEK